MNLAMTTALRMMTSVFLKPVENQIVLLSGARHQLVLFLHLKLGLDLYLLWINVSKDKPVT